MSEIRHPAILHPFADFFHNLMLNVPAPITVYLLGRSGHGKSSLINALTNSSQADVGHVTPTTPESVKYDIKIKDQNIFWTIIDSRGIFESTRAIGASDISAAKQVEEDLKKYKPDLIFHVICCSEVRNLSNDLKFLSETFENLNSAFSELPPVIVVLSKSDTFYHPSKWPIEECADKQVIIVQLLEYMSKLLISSEGSFDYLEPSSKYCGCHLRGCEPFSYVIPVATLIVEPKVIWNVDRLGEIVLKSQTRKR